MFFYHPTYSALSLPAHHRFPINKYRRLYERLYRVSDAAFITPKKITREQLLTCHDADYIDAFVSGRLEPKAQKRIGFPWEQTLVDRTLFSLGASLGAARLSLETGIAVQLGGGYHHAFPGHGSGYCIFNDLAVAARTLVDEGLVDKVLLLDLDVHQGDGSARILVDEPAVVTCSLHCDSNFPRIKESSDYDFPLPQGCKDDEYLRTLNGALDWVYRLHKPDLVLYNAGCDIYKKDELGQLDISLAGVRERDTMVMNFCKQHGLPLTCTLGGGYQRKLDSLIEAHWQLFIALGIVYPTQTRYKNKALI